MNNSSVLSPNELKERHLIARKVARESLRDFCVVTDKNYDPQWFHDVLADTLQSVYERVLKGESPRVMITMPPRHGKSETSTKKFPAWVLGKSPEFPIIVSTYSQDLSTKFGQDTRDIMNSQNYLSVFDTRMREDSKAKASWMTKEKGGYEAVGVGGAITGKGFKIGIIDDPFKNDEEAESEVIREKIWNWYITTFYTRQEGNAAIVVINTRWHDDDLSGRLLAQQKQAEQDGETDYDKWELINFRAVAVQDEEHRKEGETLWPSKFPIEHMNRTKKVLGPYKFSALYQQDPVDEESQEFKSFWFKTVDFHTIERLNTRRWLTIDPASAMRGDSDNIGVTLNLVDREGNWNFMCWKLRMNAPDLIDFMFKMHTDYQFEKVGIEEGAYQQTIKPFLDKEMRERQHFFEVIELKHNQSSKELRIRGLIPYYSSGTIYHVEGMCGDLVDEAIRFPKGAHDDVLDSAAYQVQIAQAPALTKTEASPIVTSNYGYENMG